MLVSVNRLVINIHYKQDNVRMFSASQNFDFFEFLLKNDVVERRGGCFIENCIKFVRYYDGLQRTYHNAETERR